MQNIQDQYFVLSLPLMTEAWQRDVLEKRFEILRQIYNALLQKALTRYRQMAQTRAYRKIEEELTKTDNERERKRLFKERDCLIEQYQLRKYDICRDTTKYRQYFKEYTDSPVIQNLANEVWQAISGLVCGHCEQEVCDAMTATQFNSDQEKQADVNVGLDIGFRKLAVVSEDAASVYDLPEKERRLEKRKRELVQYMERSRRSMNPDNYMPDGRIRPGSIHWVYSKNYQKAKLKYRELCRKQSVIQKQEQYQLVREIIFYGERFFVENLDFVKLCRKKPNGAYMARTAPGEFLRILDYKLSQQEKQLYRIPPFLVKATGFIHHTGSYQKMPLNKSWRIVDGQKVEKNLYSAFLLSNLAEDLQSFDLEKCTEKFPQFLEGQREHLQSLAS